MIIKTIIQDYEKKAYYELLVLASEDKTSKQIYFTLVATNFSAKNLNI